MTKTQQLSVPATQATCGGTDSSITSDNLGQLIPSIGLLGKKTTTGRVEHLF